ncbi:hypothetical protein ACFCZT_07700 [Streptomyces sp. NPDC056230]|uniref:hypothetical protein n=1 Tax=Streptomyces sp. NPDC056230 TaxID=3345754 RepID=UPI0035D9500F
MFLSPKVTATPNRYVENGPEDRTPSFHPEVYREISGAKLRYSTTSPAPVKPSKKATLAAMAKVASSARKGR